MIEEGRDESGWALRIERAVVLALRRRSYAMAACALIAIVSVSVLAQVRSQRPGPQRSGAVFAAGDTLARPEGYREWVFVGPAAGTRHTCGGHAGGATGGSAHKVYISPAAHGEYARTGQFPEGTLLVWEESSRILASMKDSRRFEGGWGFFDFSERDGTTPVRAAALPETSGCRVCHRRDAQTDHVFTQFYPGLRAARVETRVTRAAARLEPLRARAAAGVGAG